MMTSLRMEFRSESVNSFSDFNRMELQNSKPSNERWYNSQSSYKNKEKETSLEDVYQMSFQSKDLIIPLPSPNKSTKKTTGSVGGHGVHVEHPTSYIETLMHLLKGNVGSGIFAMGDAMKNAGIILGPIVVFFLGIICLYCQHILLNTAKKISGGSEIPISPDYSETAELVFTRGPARLRKFSNIVKRLVNIFLCVTQLGFCCVYFVFVSENLKMVLDTNGYKMDLHIHMAIVFIPILLTSLIRNLKFLAPLSTIANVFMTIGLLITIYYCVQDLPPISDRTYVANVKTMPLFFGTAMFAFEGIGLVLPLQKEMKKPENFKKPLGVLNVGTAIAIVMYIVMGFLAYLKYDDIKGSVTLNLPDEEVLSQCVKIIISLGILLTYSLQFYIPVEIMWPTALNYIGDTKHPVYAELVFRTLLVILTFVLAEAIPFLHLFISLVGAISSAALALMFPPIFNLVILYSYGELTLSQIIIDVSVCLCGVVGAVTGTYTSIYSIINAFGSETS